MMQWIAICLNSVIYGFFVLSSWSKVGKKTFDTLDFAFSALFFGGIGYVISLVAAYNFPFQTVIGVNSFILGGMLFFVVGYLNEKIDLSRAARKLADDEVDRIINEKLGPEFIRKPR